MLSFPGVAGSGVDCGVAASAGSQDFTLMAWINRSGTGNAVSTGAGGIASIEPIIAKAAAEAEGSNVDGNYFLGWIPGTGGFGADFEDLNTGLNHPFTFTGTGRTNATWYHVAVTYNHLTGLWSGFVNGIADGTLVVSGAGNVLVPRNDSIQHLGIGTDLNSTGARTGGWAGMISDVAIYNTDLAVSLIKAVSDSRLKGFCRQISPANLKGYFALNETSDGATASTSAGIVRDGVGANHGTIFGTLTGKAESLLTYN